MDQYLSKIPSQYITGTAETGFAISDPAYAAAYGEIRGFLRRNVSAYDQLDPYKELSPLAQTLFIDAPLINLVNETNANVVSYQNDAFIQGAAQEQSWLEHSGLFGTGSLDNTIIGKTFAPIFEAQHQLSTDPAHATLQDFILAPAPFYPLAAPYVAAAIPSATAAVTSIAAAIPSSLATIGSAALTLLTKGKDFIQTTVEKVKDALGGAKLPNLDLGGLSNFKIPDLGGLNLSSLGNLGKVSIPSGLKDALSGIIPVHPAPVQFQEAPTAQTVDIPSAGPSPVLLAGGALAIGAAIYLMRKR